MNFRPLTAEPSVDLETDVSRRRRRFVRAPSSSPLLLIAAVPSVVILGLLAIIIVQSFLSDATGEAGLDNYQQFWGRPQAVRALWTTVQFAGMSMFWAALLGISTAWLVERTDLGGRRIVYGLVTLGVVMPNFFGAMGWVYLMHPTIGTLNNLIESVTGWNVDWLTVGNIPGMAMVQGFSTSSLMFILVAATIGNMDASLEEAAEISGASFWSRMRYISIPLARPAIIGASIYVGTVALSAFDVPAIIGMTNRIYTFSTYLYLQRAPTDGVATYGLSAAFGTQMVVLALVLTWWYTRVLRKARRYEVISGKGYKARTVQLGKWRPLLRVLVFGALALAHLLPLVLIAWTSLMPYVQPISPEGLGLITFSHYQSIDWTAVLVGLRNTLTLALLAPTITVILAVAFSWLILRTRLRFRFGLETIAFLPHAVPNVVFAFAALVFTLFWSPPFLELYGTVTLLLIMYFSMELTFATRITNSSLIQIGRELEESAEASGASLYQTLRRITLPLLRPALASVWVWLALGAFRELQIASFLASPTNQTLSVLIFGTYLTGGQSASAAITILMMAFLIPLIGLYIRYGRSILHQV